MRTYSFFMSLALSLMSVASASNASVIASYLNFDGSVNIVRDDSIGLSSGSLSAPAAGDLIQGIFKVNDINNVIVSGDSVWGMFSLEVDSVSGTTASLKVPTAAGDRIGSILSAAGGPSLAGLTLKSGALSDATLVIVEAASAVPLPNFDTDFTTTLTNVFTADTWDADFVMGIVEATDFHDVTVISSTLATFDLAYTVIADIFPGVDYVTQTGLNGGMGDFVVDANPIITIGATSAPNPTGWEFSDKGDFAIAPLAIPEPATVIVWAVLAACGLVSVARRR